MSSQIYYDRGFILVGDKYIPIVNSGSNNCYEISWLGREIPEKNWSVLNNPDRQKMLFTVQEIHDIAKWYEQISMENRGGIRKSRNRSFEEGEFERWILGGMRLAHTVEEYRSYGNTVVVIVYDADYRQYPVFTTEELLEKMQELAGHSIGVGFEDNRHIYRPPMRQKGQPFDFSQLPEFYVLNTRQGYFVKRSSRRIWFAQNQQPTASRIRKFKTEKAAQKYLDDNQRFFSKYAFSIECVQNGGTAI